MPNYYCTGGLKFPVHDHEHKLIVIKALATYNEALDNLVGYGVYGEGMGALDDSDKEWLGEHMQVSDDIVEFVASLLHSEIEPWSVDYEVDAKGDDYVIIYDDEHFNADTTSMIVQGLLKLLDYDEIVSFAWAYHDSRRIPLEHGGGSCTVSKNGIFYADAEYTSHSVHRPLLELGLENTGPFFSGDANYCPKCKEEDPFINFGKTNTYESGKFLATLVECKACGHEWFNIYSIVSRRWNDD